MREGEPGWFYVGNGMLQYKNAHGWTDQYQEIDSPAKTSGAGPAATHDGVEPVIEQAGRSTRGPSSFARFCSWAARALIASLTRLIGCLRRLIAHLWPRLTAFLTLLVTSPWRLIAYLRPRLTAYLWPRLTAFLTLLASLAWRLITGSWPLIAEAYREASAKLPIRSVAGSHQGLSKSSVRADPVPSPMKPSRQRPPRSEVVPHRSLLRLGREQIEEDLEFFLDPERLRDINPDIDIHPGTAGVDQPAPR